MPNLRECEINEDVKILGIGDQGVGGILISVAKLVLTTLCAGIHPSRTLPVVLDCGTNVSTILRYRRHPTDPKHRMKSYSTTNSILVFINLVLGERNMTRLWTRSCSVRIDYIPALTSICELSQALI